MKCPFNNWSYCNPDCALRLKMYKRQGNADYIECYTCSLALPFSEIPSDKYTKIYPIGVPYD